MADEQTFPDVASFMEAQRSEAPEKEDAAPEEEAEEIETGEELEELDFEDDGEADPAELLDDDDASEDDSDDIDAEADELDETPERPAVEAPQHLLGNERETFAKLQPEAQQIVADLAKRGETVLTQRLQETAYVRQQFEQRLEGLGSFISEKEQQLAEYENVDWVAAAQQYSAEDILAAQAHRDGLRKQIETAKHAATDAERVQLQVHTRQGFADLQSMAATDSVARALIDPQKGQARLGKLKEYFVKQGVDPQELTWADARDLTIGYKAMLYDQGQAKVKSAKKKPKPAQKQVRSAPAGVRGGSANKRIRELSGKSELSREEGVELMRLKRRRALQKRKAS